MLAKVEPRADPEEGRGQQPEDEESREGRPPIECEGDQPDSGH